MPRNSVNTQSIRDWVALLPFDDDGECITVASVRVVCPSPYCRRYVSNSPIEFHDFLPRVPTAIAAYDRFLGGTCGALSRILCDNWCTYHNSHQFLHFLLLNLVFPALIHARQYCMGQCDGECLAAHAVPEMRPKISARSFPRGYSTSIFASM